MQSLTKVGTLARRYFIDHQKRVRKFLILVPIHRPPNLLKFAIDSILYQTEKDYEIHIISDGAPEETTREILSLARRHRQISAHIFTKGKRNGEAYRDSIIRDSSASFVCQIADDDIWFPNHLSQIGRLLQTYDFGHTIQTEAAPGGMLRPLLGDISDPDTARKMINERFNIFGPTASGYRKDAYLKLKDGWTGAPPDVWSDLHMWRKFLSHGDIKCGSRFSFTNIHIAAPYHKGMSIHEREVVGKEWWVHASNPASLDDLIQGLTKHACISTDNDWWKME